MLASPCYVISDTHLSAASTALERQVVAFLGHVREQAGSLLINGDLFDFWFEWKHVIPRGYFRTLSALASLCDAGVPVLMIAGNHDCWGGSVLSSEVGLKYHMGAWSGALGGWRALVEHGDGLRAVEDRRYRALRRVLRHPASVRAFRWLHPDWGSRLAHGSSDASRVHRARDGGAGLRAVAFSHLRAHPETELVVYGHSHVATLERSAEGGVYANAGSWLEQPTFLRITPDAVELRRWTGAGDGEVLQVEAHRSASRASSASAER
ncbi:MAG TPA: UDP-2,3-diacylglucosamine diphosphatase [Gemmatimonadaceae bacterium]|nr:UDP-2,3-diacylglucosamine diphosphatase [Gemmatimonadaceae bacterium]